MPKYLKIKYHYKKQTMGNNTQEESQRNFSTVRRKEKDFTGPLGVASII